MITEFTFPDLLNIIWIFLLTNDSLWFNLSDNTIFIEDSITFLTSLRISCRDLSIILSSFELYLKDVCIDLLSILSCWSMLLRNFHGFGLDSESLNLAIVLFTREVEVSIKLIRVNVLT